MQGSESSTARVAPAVVATPMYGWLGQLSAVADGLLATDLTVLTDFDVLECVSQLQRQSHRLYAASVRLVAQMDHRDLATTRGATSVGSLLAQVTTDSHVDCTATARTAAAVLPRPQLTGTATPPVLPLLADALTSGELSARHARIIVTTMNKIARASQPVDEQTREMCEKVLVDQAALMPPPALQKVADYLLQLADPDGSLDRDAYHRQEFHIGQRRDNGLTRVWGWLDDLTIEALRQALDPLARPRPEQDTEECTCPGATHPAESTSEQGDCGRTCGERGCAHPDRTDHTDDSANSDGERDDKTASDSDSDGDSYDKTASDGDGESESEVTDTDGEPKEETDTADGDSENVTDTDGDRNEPAEANDSADVCQGADQSDNAAAFTTPALSTVPTTDASIEILDQEAVETHLDPPRPSVQGVDTPAPSAPPAQAAIPTGTASATDHRPPPTPPDPRVVCQIHSSRPSGFRPPPLQRDDPRLNQAADDAIRDRRAAPLRNAHALYEMLLRYLDVGAGPTHGGEKPHVTVTVSYEVLQGKLGAALLSDGTHISAPQARMLACDGGILPAVMAGPSAVLDMGRTTRSFTPATRRAIRTRDRGCAFPGCDRPAHFTDVHHVQHWARGGRSDYSNGVLLCPHHHRVIHQEEWTIAFAPDGTPEFIPPAWLDSTRRPRRNTLHHQLDHIAC